MRKAITSICGSTHSIGWSCSIGFHAFLFCGLLLASLRAVDDVNVVLATSKNDLVLTLSIAELEADESDSDTMEIEVEVRPREVRIDNQRFQHASSKEPTFDSAELPTRLNSQELKRQSSENLPTVNLATEKGIMRSFIRKQIVSQSSAFEVETSTLPEFTNNRPPRYPLTSISQRQEGTVLLRIHLSANGEVSDIEIIETSGHRALDGAAIEAVRNWKAKPATRNGRPVETTVRLPVTFRLPEKD